jgi:molybdate transport system substrate-binding protein
LYYTLSLEIEKGWDHMKSKSWYALVFAIVLLTSVSCSTSSNQYKSEQKIELTISAAASLKDALGDVKTLYEEESEGAVALVFNFASSGTLQQQIEQGAPTDLFFSASKEKFNKLVQDKYIHDEYNKDLLSNQLVLIVPAQTATVQALQDLQEKEVQKVAIGIPESVPAGKYAKETLEFYEVWNAVEDKLILTKDVRQVLSYVETGNVDAGFVYQTDAMHSEKVRIATTVENNAHSEINYPLGIVKATDHLEEARSFFEFMQQEKVLEIFRQHGFTNLN